MEVKEQMVRLVLWSISRSWISPIRELLLNLGLGGQVAGLHLVLRAADLAICQSPRAVMLG